MQFGKGATAHVLQSAEKDKRIEVTIERQDDADCVTLRYLTWTDGLGWCGQKTIRLNADQLDELHRALTVARHRLNRQRTEAGQLSEQAQVIQLPTLA